MIEEVDHLATILPGPSTENSGTIDGVLAHVVIQKRIEVKVGHAAHLALQASHLKLRLIVHLSDQLLAVLQLHLELLLLLAVQVRALLNKDRRVIQSPLHSVSSHLHP